MVLVRFSGHNSDFICIDYVLTKLFLYLIFAIHISEKKKNSFKGEEFKEEEAMIINSLTSIPDLGKCISHVFT